MNGDKISGFCVCSVCEANGDAPGFYLYIQQGIYHGSIIPCTRIQEEVMPYLAIKKGGKEGSRIPLTKKTTVIGRLESADVFLNDKNVSRLHARIIRLDDNLFALVDLGSSNGTLVNDLPISRLFLMDGDEIQMGDTVLIYYEGKGAEGAGETVAKPVKIDKHSLLSALPLGQPTEIFTPPAEEDRTSSLKETYLQLRTLYKLISEMNKAKDLAEIYDKVGNGVLHSLGVDRIAFFHFDKRQNSFIHDAGFVHPGIKSDGIWEEFPMHQQVLSCIKTERLSYLFLEENEEEKSPGTKPSIMGVPILIENEMLGMIYLDSPKSHKCFEKRDVDFISAIAAHLGVIMRQMSRFTRLKEQKNALERAISGNLVIVCRNPRMIEIMEILNHLAETESNVLIRGESGTGKELIARAIHSFSKRRSGPLVCINCASLPETLIESELFGYERGAFTGAVSRKPGRFEIASGGTVFLDEIGDISLAAQSKILRIIQEGELQRVGGTATIKVDLRVIAATNKDLEQAIRDKQFREDLYYRLKVVEIEIPPLRERPEDITVLAEYFLQSLRTRTSSTVEQISPDAKNILLNYSWPGNVRELRNVIERALVFARGQEILPEHLPLELAQRTEPVKESPQKVGPPLSLAEMEKRHILITLDFTGGNKLRTAELLGISRSTLYEKMKLYDIRG